MKYEIFVKSEKHGWTNVVFDSIEVEREFKMLSRLMTALSLLRGDDVDEIRIVTYQ